MRRRGHILPRSLTARLVTGIVALVVVVLAAISSSTYITQRSFLYSRLDEQLDGVASGNAAALQRCEILQTAQCAIGDGSRDFQAPTTEWIVQLNSQGGVVGAITQGPTLRTMHLSATQARALVAEPNKVRTLTTTDGAVLRVVARSPGANSGILVVSGLSTDDVHKSLSRLVSVEILVGLLALVLASFATAGGVRFTLRRLRRVTTTAQEVAAELSPEGAGLDRRVPDDEPETEVGQLVTSFNTMLAAVESQFAARVESERRMRQFLADASHELRTPLTSIRGYAELARMQRAAGDSSADNIDRIESEGTRMSRLVEDLLTLARGDAEGSSRTRRELVDVDIVLDDAVSGSRAAFPERQIIAEMNGTPQVIGDPDQLLRVVRNLVTNAAVHTAPDRPITVRGWRDEQSVIVQIVDGGPGLSPQDTAHVFERFWRADKARTRARGGSGLGLSIVASIVHAHGGTVRFDSAVETGSTVTIALPAVD